MPAAPETPIKVPGTPVADSVIDGAVDLAVNNTGGASPLAQAAGAVAKGMLRACARRAVHTASPEAVDSMVDLVMILVVEVVEDSNMKIYLLIMV